ncbi:MAG: 1-(5-phosphoribosyl)-5-[(5-phosphoribosylamino)methylideneamino]imidazole-4-carboxamide isomerase [Chloroflexi bacterium]|nr:1-(5-phosphoribosyl)-5-[(5-phosphoribosylamino)methylideneamino]imidazole-4-carboxamide isomerase [Chloroflexota bacterium]
MIIYPAIDLRRGRCVRLQQGAFEAETVFADDPVDAALRWASEGAQWLHVVNLDGAIGAPSSANLAALERIVAAVEIPVQFGGGVRTADDAVNLLARGVSRVIIGSVAVTNPEVVRAAIDACGAEAVAVGIDARDGRVAIHGWAETSTRDAVDLATEMAALGVQRIVHTDVKRDGMLTGANIAACQRMARAAGVGVIASGGVANLDDVRAACAAAAQGVQGLIIGMALYRGAISLTEALRLTQGE